MCYKYGSSSLLERERQSELLMASDRKPAWVGWHRQVHLKKRGVSRPLGLWEERQGLGHDLCVQSSSLSFSEAFILFSDFFPLSLTPLWLATREGLLLFPHMGFRRFWKGPWMAQSGWVDTQVELSSVVRREGYSGPICVFLGSFPEKKWLSWDRELPYCIYHRNENIIVQ